MKNEQLENRKFVYCVLMCIVMGAIAYYATVKMKQEGMTIQLVVQFGVSMYFLIYNFIRIERYIGNDIFFINEKTIKKTFIVSLGNEKYLNTLMNNMNFYEVDRVVIDQGNDGISLAITFEGSESDLRYSDYIEESEERYYSLHYPNGYYKPNMEIFKRNHMQEVPFKIKSFK